MGIAGEEGCCCCLKLKWVNIGRAARWIGQPSPAVVKLTLCCSIRKTEERERERQKKNKPHGSFSLELSSHWPPIVFVFEKRFLVYLFVSSKSEFFVHQSF